MNPYVSGEPVARIVSPVRIDMTGRKVMNWVASLWNPFYPKGDLLVRPYLMPKCEGLHADHE